MDVSRGEFDLLKQVVARNESRLDIMDTRVVQAQLVDLVKDFAELKVDMNKRFDSHDLVHKQEAKDRVSGRRWLVGIGIAGLGSMAAILTVVLEILVHVH